LATNKNDNFSQMSPTPLIFLSTIAQRYQVPVKHLRKTNGLRSDFLRIGQKLKIPGTGFDSPLVGAMSIYTVKPGDSLWKIAKNKKVSVRNIAKWNNLDVKSPLKLGQKLKVQANGNATSSASLKKLRYKVRRGDSLSRIASKFDIKINDILAWNKLNPKKYLKPGQRLTLFVDVLNI
jgi:membrane-bound lytic murein transglycosylase D